MSPSEESEGAGAESHRTFAWSGVAGCLGAILVDDGAHA